MKAARASLLRTQHANPTCDVPLEQRNIGRYLRLRAAEDHDRTYLTIDGKTYAFAQTERRCHDLARGLAKRGIRHGSRGRK